MAKEEKNKEMTLPPEVYYLVLNGAKQYFKYKEDAEEMARKLYEGGTSPGGIYTENDPDEIQDLYDVGYFKEDTPKDEEPKYEVVNDKSIDAIKDNFTPPGAKGEETENDEERKGPAPGDLVIEDISTTFPTGNAEEDDKRQHAWENFMGDQMLEATMPEEPTDEEIKQFKKWFKAKYGKPRGKAKEVKTDEMADFQKSLDDYASKNKKGRDDIPVATRR